MSKKFFLRLEDHDCGNVICGNTYMTVNLLRNGIEYAKVRFDYDDRSEKITVTRLDDDYVPAFTSNSHLAAIVINTIVNEYNKANKDDVQCEFYVDLFDRFENGQMPVAI